MVAKDLLEILVCPACRENAPVTPDDRDQTLVCTRCGRRYPIRDGIPVMLVDEAVLPGAVPPAPGRGSPTRRSPRSA